jgi:hypothetical protein
MLVRKVTSARAGLLQGRAMGLQYVSRAPAPMAKGPAGEYHESDFDWQDIVEASQLALHKQVLLRLLAGSVCWPVLPPGFTGAHLRSVRTTQVKVLAGTERSRAFTPTASPCRCHQPLGALPCGSQLCTLLQRTSVPAPGISGVGRWPSRHTHPRAWLWRRRLSSPATEGVHQGAVGAVPYACSVQLIARML